MRRCCPASGENRTGTAFGRGRFPACGAGQGNRGLAAGLDRRQTHPARVAALLRLLALWAGRRPQGGARAPGSRVAVHDGRYVHVRSDCIERAWTDANQRSRTDSALRDGEPMLWNLRMKAAESGIWKSTELRRRLADAGLEISAGKMSALWTGTPTTVRLDDLDVICAVLDCKPTDLLICEPDKVAAHRPASPRRTTNRASAGGAATGRPRPAPPA